MTDATPTQDPPASASSDADRQRIAKRIARAGVCSRREAEAMILDGRVMLNGQILDTPAVTVNQSDKIVVDGKPLPSAEPTRLWRYFKPRGLVVSNRDEKNRSTIFDELPQDMPRVMSVGRLDLDTEGLLLLTNDGGLARYLELPSTGWVRKYRVRGRGIVDTQKLEALSGGVMIDGIAYQEIKARLDKQMPSNAWLTLALTEGKNREIRHVMDYLGYPVSRLLRLSYGPFQLGKLAENAVEEVKPAVLRDQLGEMASQFTIQTAAPVPAPQQRRKPAGRRPSRGQGAAKKPAGSTLTLRTRKPKR